MLLRCDILTYLSHLLLVLNSSMNIVIYCWKVVPEGKASEWDYISLQDEKFRSALLHLLTSQDVARRLLNSFTMPTSHHLHNQTGERRGGKTERDDDSRQDLEFLTEVPPTVTTTI